MSGFPDVGEVFEERYRLDDVIGKGGYAQVYRARQLDLDRDVAVKILKPLHRNPEKAIEAQKRFEREAKLVSQLGDPQTITVFDYGTDEDGRSYMISELVRGRNLNRALREDGPFDSERTARILARVLYSLEEAHSRGILHRDIKPANVMVYDLSGRPDQVKLLDFGIAKAFSDDWDGSDSMQVALTGRGKIMGSPGYMAPEQLEGGDLDDRTDIYSLGLVAYEMVTATRAIKALDDLKAAFMQMQGESIRIPEEFVISDKLRAIIHRMVEKTPADRYENVREILDELEPLVDGSAEAEKTTRKWQILAAILALGAVLAALALNFL